jgi:hypothetical protein
MKFTFIMGTVAEGGIRRQAATPDNGARRGWNTARRLHGRFASGELINRWVKTAKALALEHEAQVLGHLKSTRIEHGLLINFASPKFEIRKFVWNENNIRAEQKLSSRIISV